MSRSYDCVVVGGGHAAIEAALAASRMKCQTLMINLSYDTIGEMSCNPAIGGVGKGQLVKEVDILGGAMGVAADFAGIQFRQLNASKGQAVRSSRSQADRKRYKSFMQKVVSDQEYLDFLEDKVIALIVKNSRIRGVKTRSDQIVLSPTVVLAAGTFLKGRMHMGSQITPGGRIGEPASVRLTDCLEELGFEILYFKTGTPPRLDGRTIDFSALEIQLSDDPPVPFSFRNEGISVDQKLLPCYITHTNHMTHQIIQDNMHLSPMYSGQIDATGVRYCPSIEDKLKKFADKDTHHVFLEPEGVNTPLYYPNGISTGLPADVQEDFVHSIKGLEHVKITRYGYSIEHGVIHPTQLKPSLETKKIKGLFLAGQINGSTGYEEAAGQGLLSGLNAALSVKNQEPFVLKRDEAYLGVLIDDLVTKGTEEPYRMFTSRVEYRLVVREDNTDQRLGAYAFKLGLISDREYGRIQAKYESINKVIDRLKATRVKPFPELNHALEQRGSSPLRQTTSLSAILKRPEVDFNMLRPFMVREDLTQAMIEIVEYEVKYEGFISRQLRDVSKFKHLENIQLPEHIDYERIHGLSIEIRQKLKRFSPINLGQANRISGVTPAAISILMVYLKKFKRSKDNCSNL